MAWVFVLPALPNLFVEEKSECLHRRFEQAECDSGEPVARDGVGDCGGDRDVNEVVGACFGERLSVLAQELV